MSKQAGYWFSGLCSHLFQIAVNAELEHDSISTFGGTGECHRAVAYYARKASIEVIHAAGYRTVEQFKEEVEKRLSESAAYRFLGSICLD